MDVNKPADASVAQAEVKETAATGWPDHQGADFHSVLAVMHQILKPRTYLEVGTCTGASLSRASCASIAIDPLFILDQDVIGNKPSCHFFRMGSDDFFRLNSPETILGDKIDITFLDGLHYFEYLLRDFMNVERYCRRNSVVLLHDCVPSDPHVARRKCEDQSLASQSNHPTWWAGDLWKVVMLLKEVRPDLRITAYDAPPTGLIAITNLNPDSSVISDRYFQLVEAGHALDFGAGGLNGYLDSLDIKSTRHLMEHELITREFWL